MPLQKEYIDWSPLQNMLARRNAYAAQEEQAGQQGALALGQQALQALVGSMSESDEDRRLKETREFQERMQQNQIAASAKEKNTERAWDERRFRELQAQRAFAREQEAVEAQRKEMWEQDQAAKEMAHKQAELRAREGKDARDYVARMQELEEQRRFHRAETARKRDIGSGNPGAQAALRTSLAKAAAAEAQIKTLGQFEERVMPGGPAALAAAKAEAAAAYDEAARVAASLGYADMADDSAKRGAEHRAQRGSAGGGQASGMDRVRTKLGGGG